MILRLVIISFTMLLAISPISANAVANFIDPATGMEFIYVKGGCYEMGDSTGDGDPNERPVHEVCVSDFYIEKYEVTNAQFRKYRSGHNSGSYEGMTLNNDNQPAVFVSWEGATAYAKWLSENTGQKFRLPTEAEWEYACRAGTKSSRFWGNNPDEACEYANVADLTAKKHWPRWTTFACNDKHAVSAPVGSYKPNSLGIYDMLGNVWEWTEDIYNSEAYLKLPKNNPVYEGAGEYRVMRGGGWSNGPMGIRCSHRVGLSTDFGHHALGFRLVKIP
ncbi:MAG TPA: formylglycine-generating enzyme family protein [Dissulfurispiraceae bacterium]|nr:formylglycine-generating enzyme family protein [Dissulfurispiraceae bacterium]